MKKFLLLIVMAIVGLGLFLAGYILTLVKKWQAEKRLERLAALRNQHERLTRVVNGLLAKANEVDQDILYSGTSLSDRHSGRLAQACSNLVMLSESIPLIDQLLAAEQVKKSEEAILKSCRIALSISNDISEVHAATISLSSKKEVV